MLHEIAHHFGISDERLIGFIATDSARRLACLTPVDLDLILNPTSVPRNPISVPANASQLSRVTSQLSRDITVPQRAHFCARPPNNDAKQQHAARY